MGLIEIPKDPENPWVLQMGNMGVNMGILPSSLWVPTLGRIGCGAVRWFAERISVCEGS